jgi:hypothetical protein
MPRGVDSPLCDNVSHKIGVTVSAKMVCCHLVSRRYGRDDLWVKRNTELGDLYDLAHALLQQA